MITETEKTSQQEISFTEWLRLEKTLGLPPEHTSDVEMTGHACCQEKLNRNFFVETIFQPRTGLIRQSIVARTGGIENLLFT